MQKNITIDTEKAMSSMSSDERKKFLITLQNLSNKLNPKYIAQPNVIADMERKVSSTCDEIKQLLIDIQNLLDKTTKINGDKQGFKELKQILDFADTEVRRVADEKKYFMNPSEIYPLLCGIFEDKENGIIVEKPVNMTNLNTSIVNLLNTTFGALSVSQNKNELDVRKKCNIQIIPLGISHGTMFGMYPDHLAIAIIDHRHKTVWLHDTIGLEDSKTNNNSSFNGYFIENKWKEQIFSDTALEYLKDYQFSAPIRDDERCQELWRDHNLCVTFVMRFASIYIDTYKSSKSQADTFFKSFEGCLGMEEMLKYEMNLIAASLRTRILGIESFPVDMIVLLKLKYVLMWLGKNKIIQENKQTLGNRVSSMIDSINDTVKRYIFNNNCNSYDYADEWGSIRNVNIQNNSSSSLDTTNSNNSIFPQNNTSTSSLFT